MRLRITVQWAVAALMCMGIAILAAGVLGQTQEPKKAAVGVVIRVTDQTGARVAGAGVRVAPVAEGGPGRMETDAKGELALQLRPGGYAVVVLDSGFETLATHLDVKGGTETQVFPLVLQVAKPGGPVMVLAKPEKDVLELLVAPFPDTFRITAEELKGMPLTTVTVHNSHSNADEKYEGVLLADLLVKYGAPLGKELRGAAMADYVVATGSDGYKAVFSLAEVDSSFHPGEVLVADTMDGKALDEHAGPFRLVVTEDRRPAREVRNLVRIAVRGAE
jgi:hypothetical protein